MRFEGNGFSRRAAASDYALRRAAELSLEHGFSYFVVLERDEYISTTTRTTPTQTTTTSAATAYGTQTATGYGTAHVYGSTTTTFTGGETHTINHPRSVLTIRCYKDRPDVPGIVYNAEMVLRP